MTCEQNIARLRACYTRWDETKGGDHDIWLSIVSDDFHLFSLSDGRPGVEFSAQCATKEDAVRYLTGLTRDWEMEYLRMDEFLGDGDAVVAIGKTAWTFKATGERSETTKVDIWRLRDGKAVDFREFYDTADMLSAATP